MEEQPSNGGQTRFHLLGAAELTGPEGNQLLSVLARPKLLALLSYLAAGSPRGFHRRDTLVGLFWAETDPERARNALRQSLFHLRRALGEDVLLTRGDDEVGLEAEWFWCDVTAFEGALAEGRREEALELYRGELLEGFYVSDAPDYERWLDQRRTELREKAATAAWELAEQAQAEGNETAVRWAHRALSLAPLDEALVRRVIELLDRVGDRSSAIQEYKAFARRLQSELELEPAPETQALVESIRLRTTSNGHAVARSAPSAAGAPVATSPKQRPRTRPISKTPAFRLGAIAGAAAVITLFVIWAFSSHQSERTIPLDPRRVLVEPFENQTGDPEHDHLGRLAADWIARSLEGTGLVDVVPPEAAFQLATPRVVTETGSGSEVTTLAEATRAGIVISGAIYASADSITIEAIVTNVRSQRVLASVESAPAPKDDPLATIETLRQRVTGALATTFDWRIAKFADVTRQPPTYEAYRLFVEAEEIYNRGFTPDGGHYFEQAQQLFLQAFALDSTLAAALVRAAASAWIAGVPREADSLINVADAHREYLTPFAEARLDLMLASLSGDRAAALRAARKMPETPLDPAIRAVDLNHPREAVEVLTSAEYYPDAVRSVGLYGVDQMYWRFLTLGYHMLGEHEAELEAALQGREHYPNQLLALDVEVQALAALGRVDEVKDRLDESVEMPSQAWLAFFPNIDPALVATNAVFELRAHGNHAASLEVAERALSWLRSHPAEESGARLHGERLALVYYGAERWDDARSLYEKLANEYPDDVNYQGFLGTLAARRGDREEALRISEGLVGLNDPYDFGRDTYWQACIAAILGERERATELLRASFAQGRAHGIQLHRDPDLESLFDYPPFQEFLKPKG